MTKRGFEPRIALLQNTVPNSVPRNLMENTSRKFKEKLEVLMSHFHRSRKNLES